MWRQTCSMEAVLCGDRLVLVVWRQFCVETDLWCEGSFVWRQTCSVGGSLVCRHVCAGMQNWRHDDDG